MIVRLGFLIAASVAAYTFQQNVKGSKSGNCANLPVLKKKILYLFHIVFIWIILYNEVDPLCSSSLRT